MLFSTKMTENGLLDLPLEILHIILDVLDLASIYQLGAACRGLHRLIHQVRFRHISYLVGKPHKQGC